jgi:predicted aconitase
MQLTREEEEMLAGKSGYPVQKSMEILVQLGEIYDAKKMIPVSNVHMPGSSVVVAGEAGTKFVEKMAGLDGKFCAMTTLNSGAVNFDDWREVGYPEETFLLQTRLTNAYQAMGAIPCHTCTPYLIGNCPRKGEHVAWGESSAIAFANSVLGARTNREGGPSALAAALTGRVPEYGYHLSENRLGQIRVDVSTQLSGVDEFGALGYWVGTRAGSKVPVFTGITSVSADEIKTLGAGLASSGAVALYHIAGITPEAPTCDAAFGGRKPGEVFEFSKKELAEAKTSLNKHEGQEISVVCIGCPHASITEIEEIAAGLAGKKVKSHVEFWITTALPIRSLAERCGYAKVIEAAGGRFVIDTCPILSPMAEVAKKKGYTGLATNSSKLAHYAPGQWALPTYYGSLQACLTAAVTGKFGER